VRVDSGAKRGSDGQSEWINDLELGDVDIKWNWSYFNGNDPFNGPGNYSFTIILPEENAKKMLEAGWTSVKENEPYEEGDPPEWTMKVKISYKYEAPKIFLIKNGRKMRVEDEKDLADIRRDSCDQIDVVITPSRWVQGGRTGVTAYVKELYAKVRESRFAQEYDDYESV
jgi:hypothetical protein